MYPYNESNLPPIRRNIYRILLDRQLFERSWYNSLARKTL